MTKFVQANCDICGGAGKCLRIPLLASYLTGRKFIDLCRDCVRLAATRFLGGVP